MRNYEVRPLDRDDFADLMQLEDVLSDLGLRVEKGAALAAATAAF